MGTFSLTQKAKADLKSIAAYTQRKWGKHQRHVYTKQFDDVFHMLSNTPDTGIACNYIKEGYRKFPNSSHLIFIGTLQVVKLRLFEFCTNVWMQNNRLANHNVLALSRLIACSMGENGRF